MESKSPKKPSSAKRKTRYRSEATDPENLQPSVKKSKLEPKSPKNSSKSSKKPIPKISNLDNPEKQESEILKNVEEVKETEKMFDILEKEEEKIQKTVTKSLPTEPNWTDGKRIFVNKLGLYSKDAIKPHFLTISDILHPTLGKSPIKDKSEKIEKALFSTFVYDQEPIQKLIDTGIPIVIIKDQEGGMHAKLSKDSDQPNLIFAYPEKAPGLGYGVFHAKIILVQFKTFLRVCITSANLTVEDWTLLSQVIWLQDFYKTKLSITETEKQPFFAQLNDFIIRCFPKNYDCPINLYNYDFSNAAVDLVCSVSGRFTKESMHKYGFTRVGDIVQKSGFKYKEKPILTFQTSSIGMMKQKYLSDLYESWVGNTNISNQIKDLSKYLEIQYPTDSYIRKCTIGPESASCILLSRKAYMDSEFPIDCFVQLEPLEDHETYKNHLFHAKVGILAVDHKISDDTLIYLGSHNISSSAWGKMEKSNSQICISNYEIGVIFKPEKNSAVLKKNIIESLMFKYPSRKYGKGDIPWIYENFIS